MSEAREATKALGGAWHDTFGTAACPVCQPARRKDQNALTLTNGRNGLLLHCHKSKCEFTSLLNAMGILGDRRPQPRGPQVNTVQPDRSSGNAQYAQKLWNASGDIEDSPAELYLRRIRLVDGPMPRTLRFNARTWHGPSGQNLPAMIALVDGIEHFAVSRTYLRTDGAGKADLPKHAQKLMLGKVAGGHVSLRCGGGDLVVVEGIETALSVPSLIETHAASVWAALSAANMRVLRLPPTPAHLVIAADGDEAGRVAGMELASRAVHLGWTVEVKPAPEGRDWNDVLVEQKTARGTDTPRHSI